MYVCMLSMHVCMLNYRPRGWVQFLSKNVQYLNDNSIFIAKLGAVLTDTLTYIHTCSTYIHAQHTYIHTYMLKHTYVCIVCMSEVSKHVCMSPSMYVCLRP